ncbi:MAG TPA: alpha/beta fold hydrolase [Acidiphilium sp.]|nr:alpha/beta fold hydrolase [Acidiphilium sp.]
MSTDTKPIRKPTQATPANPPITGERVSTTDAIDRALHAAQAKFTAGLSPAGLALAWRDWAVHLANQPARRMDLTRQMFEDAAAISRIALGLDQPSTEPCPDDRRFTHPRWQDMPYSLYKEQFLRSERWWHDATTAIAGVDPAHERIVSFITRQALDAIAPTNFPLLNPEVTQAARDSAGQSVRAGFKNLLQDSAIALRHHTELPLQPGKDVAVTPGTVIYRNALIELIQYTPTTATVRPEPLLIVPAWIMKYYILDLSPQNSLVRYLTEHGYTVFMISWHNPTAADRDLGLDDYRTVGIMAAMDAVSAITGAAKIHAVGYCLGGTLLSMAAAAMARDHDERLASLSLFAAQTDFTEAGELQLFITESQLAFLDDIMWHQGYLDTTQMAGAFQMLRSNDLIWSRMIRRYFIGDPENPNDLMSWNQDATRMPYRMHAEYLRHLFLHNDLAEGRLNAGDHPVAIGDITAPFFVVGTERDHIAPWHSVYKLHLLNHGPLTFVLTSGGHNAGIVSEPGHPHRHFALMTRPTGAPYRAPDEWQRTAPVHEGSWWPEWVKFLAAHSGAPIAPPAIGRADAGYHALGAAPGRYIHEM